MILRERHWDLMITALGLALGGAGAWAVSGRFALIRACVLCTTWLVLRTLVARQRCLLWQRVIGALVVPVSWFAGAAVVHAALVVSTAVVLTQVLAGLTDVSPECAGLSAKSAAAVAYSAVPNHLRIRLAMAAYGIVLVGTALGAVPVWATLVLVAVPWAVRATARGTEGAWREWMVVFDGQLVLAFLIWGIVR